MFNLDDTLRENIKNLVPYSSARDEFKGKEGVFLDANENSLGSPLQENYNRYPDPLQHILKDKISKLKGISPSQIFLGNGSDEAIDILFRAFCNPKLDTIIINPPTYGMYEVAANINDVKIKKVNLTSDFQIDLPAVLDEIEPSTKLIFFCCPNNPTGNSMKATDIKEVLEHFKGIVVVDEAYIDFAPYDSLLSLIASYPNLVVLQTFSKAWGMAGLRLGMAFASAAIIAVFNKIKAPYNINELTQQYALKALGNKEKVKEMVDEIIRERAFLEGELKEFNFVLKVYPSQANFILVKTNSSKEIYNHLILKNIIIRDRSSISLCEGCLRITVGTREENRLLIDELRNINL